MKGRAMERTALAWWRTALAVAVGAAALLHFDRSISWPARIMLMTGGLAMFVCALVRSRELRWALAPPPPLLVLTMTVAVGLVGFAALFT